MVITFALYPLSYNNYITKPRAQFLLSLLEGLTIDFPSHFILLLMDVHKDTMTHDKLIFPSTITKILLQFSVSYPEFPHFSVMCAIDVAPIRRNGPNFNRSGHGPRWRLLQLLPFLLLMRVV